jgi:Leucine-rich repeat (LRR) protein
MPLTTKCCFGLLLTIVSCVTAACNKEHHQKTAELIYEPFMLEHGDRLTESDLRSGVYVIFIRDLPKGKEDRTSPDEDDNRNDDSDMVQLAKMPHLNHLSVCCPRVTSTGFAALDKLELEELIVRDAKIDDAGIKYLASSTGLRVLILSGTLITDNTVEFAVRHFPALQQLDISDTAIDDRAVPMLSNLKHLRELDLGDTKITDESVPALSRMTHLRTLNVAGDRDASISKAGADRLRRALPNTRIYHWSE